MWTMILLLWVIPVALGVVALMRMAIGTPPMKRQEWRLFFGKSTKTTLSLWMGLKFAAFAIGFFIVGVTEAVIFPNLGSFWFLVAPLLTAGATILLLLMWVRSGSIRYRMRQKHNMCGSRIIDILFR